MEVFYLFSYSPDHNPDERLNASFRHALRPRAALRTKAELRHATEAHMTRLQTQPEGVRAFFGDPRVSYAA